MPYTLNDYLTERLDEYHHANIYSSCGCGNPNARPPCSFCEDGYSLSEKEFTDMHIELWREEQEKSKYGDYERAMKGLPL